MCFDNFGDTLMSADRQHPSLSIQIYQNDRNRRVRKYVVAKIMQTSLSKATFLITLCTQRISAHHKNLF